MPLLPPRSGVPRLLELLWVKGFLKIGFSKSKKAFGETGMKGPRGLWVCTRVESSVNWDSSREERASRLLQSWGSDKSNHNEGSTGNWLRDSQASVGISYWGSQEECFKVLLLPDQRNGDELYGMAEGANSE